MYHSCHKIYVVLSRGIRWYIETTFSHLLQGIRIQKKKTRENLESQVKKQVSHHVGLPTVH